MEFSRLLFSTQLPTKPTNIDTQEMAIGGSLRHYKWIHNPAGSHDSSSPKYRGY